MLSEGEKRKLISRFWNAECESKGSLFFYQLAVGTFGTKVRINAQRPEVGI